MRYTVVVFIPFLYHSNFPSSDAMKNIHTLYTKPLSSLHSMKSYTNSPKSHNVVDNQPLQTLPYFSLKKA